MTTMIMMAVMVELLVVMMLIGTTSKMMSEWLISLLSSLFGALCQRGRN
jgi:hypothetical protein